MNKDTYPEPTRAFYKWLVVLGALWMAGGYTDMWAHAHVPELETFFTPWHGVFYAGFFSFVLLYVVTAFLNHRQGYPWRYSLPKEYHIGLLGVIIFFIGGLGDMVWHTFLGIEKDLEIIISPPHILIAAGAMMVTFGFLMGIWSSGRNLKNMSNWVTVMVITYVMLSFNYLLDYFNPFAFPYMSKSFEDGMLFYPQIGHVAITPQLSEILGLGNMILFTSFMMSIILMTIRYWRPPFGAFTTIFTLNVLAVIVAYGRYYQFILTAFIAGFLIDLLFRYVVDRHPRRHIGLRLFGFFTPFILFTLQAVTIILTDANTWSLSMWGGAIIISGFIGYLLTALIIPPRAMDVIV